MEIKQPSMEHLPKYLELRGKTALITGSGRRIGKGIAERLAIEGMSVFITGLDSNEVQTTVMEFCEKGYSAAGVAVDLRTQEGIKFLFSSFQKEFDHLDLLVNNAAVIERHKIFDMPEGLVDLEIDVNLRTPYFCSVAGAQMMRSSGGGTIINISSIGGERAHWRGLPYDITKGGLNMMTRAMALDLAEFGIRVNGVAPGAIHSGFPTTRQHQKYLSVLASRIPLNRAGTPADVAGVVAFLASDDASYITGQIITVDGGATAQLYPEESPI